MDERTEDAALTVADVELTRARLQRAWRASHQGEPPAFTTRACREAGHSRWAYRRALARLARAGVEMRLPREPERRMKSGEAAVKQRARDRQRREGVVVVRSDPEEDHDRELRARAGEEDHDRELREAGAIPRKRAARPGHGRRSRG